MAPAPSEKPHLFLVDGYSFVFRAYHSLPPLTRKDGTPVGAVYGFTNMLLRLREKTSVDKNHYLAVMFDAGRESFRTELYPEYKANRPEAPEDLKPQFPLVKEAATALNIPSVELKGYEADDLIATYVRIAREQGFQVTIVSSDKDLMQLIGDDVAMYDTMKEKRIGPDEVREKFGVGPEHVRDVLALIGDTSDNIPGVPGIGPKTAAELVNEYGSFNGVLEHAHEVKQNKRRETLLENRAKAELSYELVKLCNTAPIPQEIRDFAVRPVLPELLMPFLEQNNFASLLTRAIKFKAANTNADAFTHTAQPSAALPEVATKSLLLPELQVTLIQSPDALEKWFAQVESQFSILDADPRIILATPEGKIAVLEPAAQSQSQGAFDFDAPAETSQTLEMYTPILRRNILQPNRHVIALNCKRWMHRFGAAFPAYDDLSVLHYVLKGASDTHDLQRLISSELGSEESYTPEQLCWLIFPVFAALQRTALSHKQLELYYTLERPLIRVLFLIEQKGVFVEPSILRQLSSEFAKDLATLEQQIHSLAGREFNIGSPKQLGEILFDEMKLPGGKRSKKTGAYGTDSDVLEELSAEGHTIADAVLDWRGISKLRSTYTESLQKDISPHTHRVHTTFEQTLTTTGRLSSREPNLQNIPVRDGRGAAIRVAFRTAPGYRLISADYSQIELRLLAHVAGIASLQEAFRTGQDIHALTASQVFGVPIESVDSTLRRRAKAINFGIIYGQSAFGLAKGLGISRTDAKTYIDAYFLQYPGIQAYMQQTIEEARQHGYVTTLFGRRCYTPGIHDKNPARRQFAERAAINAPLQGSAADIIKRAMVLLSEKLADAFPQSQMVLQVHDELLVEAPDADAATVATLMKSTMESVITLSVPLTVEAKIGAHWGEVH